MHLTVEDITIEDWNQWRSLSATKSFVAGILNARDDLKEDLAQGHLTDKEIQIAIGVCQGLKEVVEFIVEKRTIADAEGNSISSHS